MKNNVVIFDTTLRDGEQAPGASLTVKEKLEIARQLASLGVDVIEAGFPISSVGNFEAVSLISKDVKGPVICGLARAIPKDIDRAYEALKNAKRKRIHVFLATSKIHMQYKLQKAEEEILRLAVSSVKYARNLCDDVEFSPEDASRTEQKFLFKVIEEVIKAGATTINIPDTVGYAIVDQFGRLIRDIRENVPNISRAIISVHCHDDLGLAVANSLVAIDNGARQVECTINGIGERAGSACLEEIVMAIKVRRDCFGLSTNINTKDILKTSKLVSRLTGFEVARNKAIVGQNAFSHESGIHQDGVLKKRSTYEIINPKDVGVTESNIVLGKLSGRHAFVERLKKIGVSVKGVDVDKSFAEFKVLADKKKTVFDEDILKIVEGQTTGVIKSVKLKKISFVGGTGITPSAEVVINFNKKDIHTNAKGDGPVDACCKAIEKAVGFCIKLEDYSLRSVTKGKEALGEVVMKIEINRKNVTGRGVSTDVVEASANAFVDGINRYLSL